MCSAYHYGSSLALRKNRAVKAVVDRRCDGRSSPTRGTACGGLFLLRDLATAADSTAFLDIFSSVAEIDVD